MDIINKIQDTWKAAESIFVTKNIDSSKPPKKADELSKKAQDAFKKISASDKFSMCQYSMKLRYNKDFIDYNKYSCKLEWDGYHWNPSIKEKEQEKPVIVYIDTNPIKKCGDATPEVINMLNDQAHPCEYYLESFGQKNKKNNSNKKSKPHEKSAPVQDNVRLAARGYSSVESVESIVIKKPESEILDVNPIKSPFKQDKFLASAKTFGGI